MGRIPKKAREYITAISIEAGIVTLIEPDGNIGYYRQRGITKLTDYQKAALINMRLLDPQWARYREVPSNWSIEFEDEEIMGKAHVTFSIPKQLK